MADASTVRAVVDHAGVSVASLARSEPFYRQVLGFDLVEDRFEFAQHQLKGVVLANPQGARVELFERLGSEPTGPHHQIESTRRQGWFQFALTVPDIEQTFAAVVAAGAEPSLEPTTAPDGVSLVAFVRDPDGNLVEFLQRFPRHCGVGLSPAVWQLTRHDAVRVLTYRRPPENVLGFADLAELDGHLVAIAADQDARVVVLTGGTPGYFVAHADLADVEHLVLGTDPGPHGPQSWTTAMQRIADIPQPVVAAVNGQAWGGGFELALACLLRVASQGAHLRFVEVAHGAIPGAGGTQRLTRLVGLSRAARLVLAGEVLTAGQAEALGILDAVVPDENFLTHVLTWVAPIAAAPRHSLAAAKRALVAGAELPLTKGLALEQSLFREVLSSPQTRALHASA